MGDGMTKQHVSRAGSALRNKLDEFETIHRFCFGLELA